MILAISIVFLVAITVVTATFLMLMRQGYRWARTVLTGGAIASVVYSVTSLFAVERHPAAATAYAGTVIIGSVLIAGGVFLLHRKDAHDSSPADTGGRSVATGELSTVGWPDHDRPATRAVESPPPRRSRVLGLAGGRGHAGGVRSAARDVRWEMLPSSIAVSASCSRWPAAHWDSLAGKLRRGHRGFRRAAIGLSLGLVGLLALFSLSTRGLVWLLIMIAVMVGVVLITRPAAQAWYESEGRR